MDKHGRYTWSDFYDKYITNIDTNKTNGVYINDYEFINNVKYNHVNCM